MELNFNAQTVAPQQAFEPLAGGWYVMAITGAEQKVTNAGTGTYLKLELTVVDGPFKGRKVWTNLNLNNPNPKAVEIAQQQLSAICHAIGVMQLQNSQQLMNIPMGVKLSIRKQDGYEDSNDVRGFKNAADVVVQTAASAPVQQVAAPVQQVAPQQFVQQQFQPQQQQQMQQTQQFQQVQQVQQVPQQGQQAQPWQHGAPVQGPVAQQQQQAVQQQPAPEITTAQQPATDTAGQAAAQSGVAPWLQK